MSVKDGEGVKNHRHRPGLTRPLWLFMNGGQVWIDADLSHGAVS